MKIDFNRVDDLNARMTIVIEKSDYGPKMDENLRNYSKKVNLKGFRSGKTPKNVLTKMYGKGMLEEAVSTILNEQLSKYLADEKIDVFGSPLLAEDSPQPDFNPKNTGDYTFIFDMGLKPDFPINYQIEAPLDVMTVETDQESLDKDILHYRRIFGSEVEVEDGAIEENDRVEVRLISKANVEDVVETVVDLNNVKGNAASILPGLKKGATLEADLEEFFGQDKESILKNILKQNTGTSDEPLLYAIEVTNIFRPQSTELSGDQISKFVGQQIEDEAGFRKILEDRDRNANATRTSDMKKMAVRMALLKMNSFEIPEEFLLKWVNSQRDKKIEPGSREAKNLFREAKWSLLLNRISKDTALEVTEKDVQKQVTKWVVENVNYMQTDIRKLMKELYENEYFMSTMKENALEEVVFGHIIPQVQFVEKGGTAKEFEHAFHDLHHELFDHGDHHDHSHV